MGDLTENFSLHEFECQHCGEVVGPTARLLWVLQNVRTARGVPLRIVSGFRCSAHNRVVGGSPNSQHLGGRAADVPGGYASAWLWRDAGAIGIGVRRGLVVHVDVRPGRRAFTFAD